MNKAINFIDFCKKSTCEQIYKAIPFYSQKFSPEIVLNLFENWTIIYDDSVYRSGIILTNTHSNGKWKTTITINDNAEYTFADNMNSS